MTSDTIQLTNPDVFNKQLDRWDKSDTYKLVKDQHDVRERYNRLVSNKYRKMDDTGMEYSYLPTFTCHIKANLLVMKAPS